MHPNPVVAYVGTDAAKLAELFAARFAEMRQQGFEVVAFTAPGAGVVALEELGVEVVPIPAESMADPTRQAATWVLLASAFIERRVLLVHSQSLSLHLVATSAARAASVPVVCASVHTHGREVLGARGPWVERLGERGLVAWFRAVAALVDAYIVQHRGEEEFAREAVGVPAEKLHRIEALVGVDVRELSATRAEVPSQEEARARLGLAAGARWVGTFGRVGLPEASAFIGLVDRVQREDPTVGWAIGASGALAEALAEPLRARRRDGRLIALLPSRLARERASLLSAVDVVALPWGGHGAGLLAMEAAAMRRPVVAFDRADTRDVVVEGQTGVLCGVGDARGFAEAVVRLARSERLRRDMGTAARARAEQRFDAEQGQLALFALYDGLIRQKVPGV